MAKSTMHLGRTRIHHFGGKLGAQFSPYYDVRAILTPAVADMFGVKNVIFKPNGDVKPGVKKSDLDFEGTGGRLVLKPSTRHIEVKGLGLETEILKLHKVSVIRAGGVGKKPPVAMVNFRVQLPTSGDEQALVMPFLFALKGGGAEFDCTISFQITEQTDMFAQAEKEDAAAKKKAAKKASAKKAAKKETVN